MSPLVLDEAPPRRVRPPRRTRPLRLTYLASHPSQYAGPLLARVAAEEGLLLEAVYLSDFSIRAFHDPEFDRAIRWDTPLLGGVPSRALSRDMPGPRLRPLAPRLEAALAATRPDALWVHGWVHQTAWRAALWARRKRVRLLLRGETPDFGDPLVPARTARDRVLAGFFARADVCLAVGRLNRVHFLRRGVPPRRIVHCPYVVDDARFVPGPKTRERRRAWRAALGLPLEAPVLLFVGKLVPRKRPGDLLEAYRRLVQDLPAAREASLVFVGEGPERADLEAAAEGLPRVRFLGFRGQEELPLHYAGADLLVLPSAYEPFGLVVNEAMSAGLAIVTSDAVGAHADLVVPGRNGDVARTGDVRDLTARLRSVLGDPARLREFGRASRERIASWNLDAAARGIRQALEGPR